MKFTDTDEISKCSTNGIKQFESKYSHSTVNIQLHTVNTFIDFNKMVRLLAIIFGNGWNGKIR